MLKESKTVDGQDIISLPFSSKARIIKICDNCQKESETSWNTILRCRKKHNTEKDYCLQCSVKIYNSGVNNTSKKLDVRKKISIKLKGKSKTFKDGKNLRILDRKVSTNGYIFKWNDKYKKHILEHKLIMSESLNCNPNELKQIHHIDGDKTNNKIENLMLMLSNSEHSKAHSQLSKVAFDLVRRGVIQFNKEFKQYFISPSFDLKTMDISYGFDDIAIKQKKNICNSRLEVKTESEILRGIKLQIPIIASNMSTVVNDDFCIKLFKLGALGIMHRADTEDILIKSAKNIAKECELVAVSIGIGEGQFFLAKKLINSGANIICIDIAHGYSDSVISLAKKIKKYNSNIKIIIGNTTNTDLLFESYDFVDAIKVGIAQGFACETKNTAGCTEKQFSAIFKFKHLSKNFGIPIISDGGIREPADFVKSIAAGANSIMAGKIFAACPESAAETVFFNNSNKKIYAGMASRYVQNKWKGGIKDGTCPEGTVKLLEQGESVEKLLKRYIGALRSGITYAGGNNIQSLQQNVEFIKI